MTTAGYSAATRLVARPTVGLAVLTFSIITIAVIFAPLLSPFDPLDLNPFERMRPMSLEHPFGTDMLGRDVFSRTLYGGRLSLIIGICVAFATIVLGVAIGLVAGFFRLADLLLMRIIDGLQAIPAILLAIAIAATAGGGVSSVILAITLAEIPLAARLVRGMVLSLREQPYVEAARAAGSTNMRIMLRHILPNTVGTLIVQATYVCGVAILFEAYLSFLGAGIPPENPSWGNIMAEGRNIVLLAPWTILCPGICVALVVLTLNEIGDGLRDLLDPRATRPL